ncbi:MAG: hypothetical protein U9Q58_06515 [Pseudomonadota bacterium]|nr:hypothetical protein [Pseudomonadota bacterium]
MTIPTTSTSPSGEEFALLSDTQIKTFFAAGYEVKGLGVWTCHTLMGFEDDIFKITPPSSSTASPCTGG